MSPTMGPSIGLSTLCIVHVHSALRARLSDVHRVSTATMHLLNRAGVSDAGFPETRHFHRVTMPHNPPEGLPC
jgi:hypothetical protein